MNNRDIQATWKYHDGTKHSYWSIRNNPHFLDWANRPQPFKIYPEDRAVFAAAGRAANRGWLRSSAISESVRYQLTTPGIGSSFGESWGMRRLSINGVSWEATGRYWLIVGKPSTAAPQAQELGSMPMRSLTADRIAACSRGNVQSFCTETYPRRSWICRSPRCQRRQGTVIADRAAPNHSDSSGRFLPDVPNRLHRIIPSPHSSTLWTRRNSLPRSIAAAAGQSRPVRFSPNREPETVRMAALPYHQIDNGPVLFALEGRWSKSGGFMSSQPTRG